MLRNYLSVLWRNILKNKTYYFLNIAGLSIAFASGIAIMLYSLHELSYDKHHTKKNRIFRVIQGGDSDEQSSSVPFPTGPSLINDYPDIVERVTRIFNFQASSLGIVIDEGNNRAVYNEPRFYFADSSYFQIFDHEFIHGEATQSLTGPGMIVVTETMARKLFSRTDVLGRTIKFEGRYDMAVTGVIKDVPSNAHFRFDYLASFASLQTLFENGIPEKNWYWNPVWTYALIREGESAEALEPQFPHFVKKYFHPSLVDKVTLTMQPMTDIYLRTRASYEISPMSDIRYVYIFISTGVFILVVACINFINLSTAHASRRAKEIGVRKSIGGSKQSIGLQFLAESFAISIVSALAGIVLYLICLPWVNQLSGKTFFITTVLDPKILTGILGLIFICGLGSGVYPAWILSGLSPVRVLKGQRIQGGAGGRQLLVSIQFIVSVVLIISTIAIERQVRFLREQKLGFNDEHIIAIPVQRTKLAAQYDQYKERILQHKDVRNVTTSNTLIGKDYQASNYKVEGKEEALYPCLFVRNDFLKTMEIPVLGGRDFSDSISGKGYRAIVNRAFIAAVGWQSPEDAVGKTIEGTLEGPMQIVGVCEDFNYAPLKEASGPVVLVHTDHGPHRDFFTRFIYVKVNGHNLEPVIAFLSQTWKNISSDNPFEYSFLDDNLKQLYIQEEKFSSLGKVFGLIAIAIGSLGLWGLSAYYVERRRKEIGVRKTFGAGLSDLSLVLSKDFVKPVLAACVVGIPFSYYIIDRWLENFAYRTSIDVLMFAFGILMIVCISMIVVSYHLLKGIKTNPVAALRED